MALRGKEETFVRRFAAGGNDGVPFDPRGYGDHSRRFAARGNEMVDHENKCESGDGYHPRRFAARGNEDHDLLYDSSPIFDEYEDDVWYAWATGGSYRCGFDEAVRLNENSLSPKIAGMFAKKNYVYVAVYSLVTGGDRNLTDDEPDSATIVWDENVEKEEARNECLKIYEESDGFLGKEPNCLEFQKGLYFKDMDGCMDYMHEEIIYKLIVVTSLRDNLNEGHVIIQNCLGSKSLNDEGPYSPNLQNSKLYGFLVGINLFEREKPLMNKKWFNAPFDPGGTSPEPDETTREVE